MRLASGVRAARRAVFLLLSFLAVPAFGQYFRGVNLAGAEFGDNQIPGAIGSSHTYNSESSFAYFAAKGLPLIRLPIRWERLQPQPGGPLDSVNLAALKQDVAWAKGHGAKIALDIHNYGRYRMRDGGVLNEYIIDNSYNGAVKVSSQDFADLWVRLSNEFKNEPAVYAYDLMNEPHDMGSASWKNISQAAVTAIRNNNDAKLIMVPGDSWSSANRWPTVHGPRSWINDPLNNFVYQAHQYFDSDESGSYKRTYNQELTLDANLETSGETRFSHFFDWCKSNNVGGYLGEFGIPNDDPRWAVVLDRFLTQVDIAGFDASYWAAGEWWGSYSLSVQPLNNFTVDRPQLAVLLKHLAPPGPNFVSVSAANTIGSRAAPDSLVSGYGSRLAPRAESAIGFPLPTALAGIEVELTDSRGMTSRAPLLYVSPTQINYLVPADLATGRVSAAIKNMGEQVASGILQLDSVSPSVFTANQNGSGVPAAQLLRVKADGTSAYEELARFDSARNKFVAVPIDFGGASDRLFLVLYGTGFRNASGAQAAGLLIGSTNAPISYLGRQATSAGLDQVNAELPRTLIGAGETTVYFKAGGSSANQVTLQFR